MSFYLATLFKVFQGWNDVSKITLHPTHRGWSNQFRRRHDAQQVKQHSGDAHVWRAPSQLRGNVDVDVGDIPCIPNLADGFNMFQPTWKIVVLGVIIQKK